MITLAAAWPSWLEGILTVTFLIVCVLMVLTVLIQKPQGGGLAGALGGGAGSGQTAFGTKTGDALTVLTIIVFAVFVMLGIALNFGVRARHTKEVVSPTSVENPTPTPPPTNAPTNTPTPSPSTQAPAGAAPAATPEAPKPEATKPEAPKDAAPATAPPTGPATSPTPAPAPAPTPATPK